MRVWCKVQDDILHPAIQKPTFNLLVKPKLSKKTDEELDDWLSRHPLEKSRKLFRGAARGPVNEEALEDATRQFNFVFERMELALSEGDWLCGREYTLADVACAPILDRLGQCDWLHLFEPYPRLSEWSERIREREAFKKMRPKDIQRFVNLDL
jgi:glutathione S-transferase